MDTSIVIIGGGIAGLTVAKLLAENGFKSTLVEQESALGGHVREWACMATDKCLRCHCCSVESLADYAIKSDKIDVRTGWKLASASSFRAGAKHTVLKQVGTTEENVQEASALVFTTGFTPYDPAEKILLGHGRIGGVFTLAEVDSMLRNDTLSYFAGDNRDLRVAFFQCVGSRDAVSGANYCSQYCCQVALRMALKLVHELPEISVTIFYIDLQLAGKYGGTLFENAKAKGIRMLQGVPGEIKDSQDKLQMIIESQGRNENESFDRVILSIGQRPKTLESLSQLGLSADEFGFIQSRGLLDSSRTDVPGVYVAGSCCGPKNIENTLEHAGQTAEAIMADLRRGEI
jgi:heterodisulfide reductase subunit A-like polyferredoxin